MEAGINQCSAPPGEALKILFLPTWYPDEDNPSSGVFIHEHARAAALHNEVRVLYVKADRPARCPYIREGTEDGVKVRRIRYKTLPVTYVLETWLESRAKVAGRYQNLAGSAAKLIRGAWNAVFCARTILAFRGLLAEGWKPDIIHAHVYGAGFPAVLIGKAWSIPVVVSEHLTTLAAEKLNWFEKFKARTVARGAGALLPVNQVLSDALTRLGGRDITIVHNVVNIDAHGVAQEHEHPVGALAITSKSAVKRLDILIEAANAVSRVRTDFQLTVVGVTTEDFGPKQALARELEADGTVRFLGRIPKEDVCLLYTSDAA